MSTNNALNRFGNALVLTKLFLTGLLAFHYVPLLISAFYNLPTSVDDYCYADTVKEYGMLEAMRMYTEQVSGRYVSTFFQHVFNTLSYGEYYWGFKVLPVLFLAAMVAAVAFLFRQWPFMTAKRSVLVAALAVSGFVSNIPSLAEGLYWFASLVVHWLGLILFFVNVGFLLKILSGNTVRRKTLWQAVAMILLASGASEPIYLSYVGIVFAVMAYRLLNRQTLTKPLLYLAATGVIGALSIKFSPSNMGKQNKAFSEVTSDMLLQVWREVIQQLSGFTSLYVIGLLVLFLLTFGNQIKASRWFNVSVAYVALVWFGLLFFNHFIGVVGIGGSAPRIWNIIYALFLSGLWFMAAVLWHKYGVNFTANHALLAGLTAVLLLFSVKTKTTNIYRDVKHGTFVAYEHEIADRIALLKSDKQGVIALPLIKNQPYSLFFQDMNSNPHGLWTKCLGSYYGKQEVIFTE